ncbi:hypothetical protein SAMN02745121_08002 [Nannocystis exedens]|uniref:Uncharacterized protein n=1 Tax=Nannocystis exedens TaxID=54 RepID=A0A1I2HMW1_9BACT|nr:hypothetical protein [Nannocystis exedens]PCC74178.1 hypothetical protein NAEX_07267 [Nannocystis exedens]SFF29741.1 hypothetical protein SAMN02745121_08002 [Nannocystis exedens]
MHSLSDPPRIPARLLESWAGVTGHALSLHAASAAAGGDVLSRCDHRRVLADC